MKNLTFPKPKTDKQKQCSKNRRDGKAFQTTCAKLHYGKNVGGLGGEDIEHSVFSIEAKRKEKSTTHNIMKQAIANCPKGKIPIIHIHQVGNNFDDDLVCIRFADWKNIAFKAGMR